MFSHNVAYTVTQCSLTNDPSCDPSHPQLAVNNLIGCYGGSVITGWGEVCHLRLPCHTRNNYVCSRARRKWKLTSLNHNMSTSYLLNQLRVSIVYLSDMSVNMLWDLSQIRLIVKQ